MKKLIALCLLLTLLCGCNVDKMEPASNAVATEETEETLSAPVVKERDEFGLSYLPEFGLNPLTCTATVNRALFSLMYESMFVVSNQFRAEPVLCESFRVSDDGMTYRFTLVEGVRFSDGTPLTAEDVKESIKAARQSALYKARLKNINYVRSEEDGTLTIISYNGDDSIVLIPDEIDGKQVTRIGEWAFQNGYFTKVIIPEGVTAIEEGAFSWCENLWSVTLPSTLKEIGYSAFGGCSLTGITLPEGLLSIGNFAFEYNTALDSLHIPASVEYLGGGFIAECYNMQSITLAEGNEHYKLTDGAIYSINGETLVLMLSSTATSFTVPEGVTEIAANAFAEKENLKTITLPQSLKCIREYAFMGCTQLGSITLPDCTYIGDGAFERCEMLTEIVIPEGIDSIQYATFFNCHALERVTLPQSVTDIAADAFYNCTALTDINLHSGIEYIDEYAFDSCENIKPTVMENTYAYDWCVENGLQYVVNGVYTPEYTPAEYFTTETLEDGTLSIIGYTGTATKILIPPQMNETPVTDIAADAFSFCEEITSVTLPEGVKTIGCYAFNGCESLRTIKLPNTLETIDDLAFQGCNLRNVTLPNSVKRLGWNVFNNNPDLNKLVVPTSVTMVAENTIVWNEDGTGITITGDISNNTFSNWTEIEEVIVQDGCTAISESAFMHCYSLRRVSLPETVTSLGARVFAECWNLEKVNIPNEVTELMEFIFSSCSLEEIILPEKLELIGENAFQCCDYLLEVVIPYGTKHISDRAFAACGQLERVTIPSTVETIEGDIFKYGYQKVVIAAPAGSRAIEYAQQMGYKYEIIEEEVPENI